MIVISNKYAIGSDDKQWKIYKHVSATEKSDAHWVPIKFFGSLSSCIEALRGLLIRTSDYQSFADLERNIREINRLLDKKLKVAV